jgi:hypothetical protein
MSEQPKTSNASPEFRWLVWIAIAFFASGTIASLHQIDAQHREWLQVQHTAGIIEKTQVLAQGEETTP